jgi:hypothetical protein
MTDPKRKTNRPPPAEAAVFTIDEASERVRLSRVTAPPPKAGLFCSYASIIEPANRA